MGDVQGRELSERSDFRRQLSNLVFSQNESVKVLCVWWARHSRSHTLTNNEVIKYLL